MSRWMTRLCLVAGSADALTGALLLASPALTLGLMGIGTVPAEPVFLRFVGVFVGAVGLSYLLPFAGDPARRATRLRTVLEVTALVRACVAVFVALAIASGSLALAWASVAVTDAALALVQISMLRASPAGALA
jgi:hypothetical protein